MAKGGPITLTVHGLSFFGGEVDGGGVFAEKFSAFIKVLANHACAATNGGERRHQFIIDGLAKNTATAVLREHEYVGSISTRSSSTASIALEEIRNDTPAAAFAPREFARHVVALNRDAGKRFEFWRSQIRRRARR